MALVIPNTFGAQSGNVPASQLDTDFSTIANYVNAREITQGALAARPAAATAGKFYFATDSAGGTYYFDTGTTWVALGPGIGSVSVGSYSVRNLVGLNNAGTPNTKYDMSADLVAVRNPSTGALRVQTNTGTLTCDLTMAQVGNGRDSAGALATGAFVHLYFIGTGSGAVQTLASATAPPTGPTLPSTFTEWGYAGAVWNAAGPALRVTYMRGAWMYLETTINLYNALSGTAENTQSVALQVPANALAYKLEFTWFGATAEGPYFRVLSGANYLNFTAQTTTGTSAQIEIPNVGQQFLWKVDTNSRSTTINISSYKIPNGGD